MLEVKDLGVQFETKRGTVQALRGVNLSIREGEAVGVVGESGSGKSVMSLAVMGLLASNARINSGSIKILGERRVAMIFQDPMTSLNPSFNVEYQLSEVLRLHQKTPRAKLREKCLHYLDLVGIPDPTSRLKTYPHQLSGGMAQRVMIALAMACEPRLLIADEPTTALDVTIQAQVLSLIRRLQQEKGLSLLLISHDMGVIAQNTSRTSVMYAGEVVETGPTDQIIRAPNHPYTAALLECLPSRHSASAGRGAEEGAGLPSIPGVVPDLLHRPTGCQFRERCVKAAEICKTVPPMKTAGDRGSRCHFA